MRTLIVHPYDPTTLELEKAYAGKPADVLHRADLSRSDVEEALSRGYDRIVLLGHGTEHGLYNFNTERYVFDRRTYADHVAPRGIETVAIWCHANLFFLDEKPLGKVFSTGMFISEEDEARQYGLNATEKEINSQFRRFSKILNIAAFLPMHEIREYIEKKYRGKGEIIKFNRQCMGFE